MRVILMAVLLALPLGGALAQSADPPRTPAPPVPPRSCSPAPPAPTS